MRVLYYNWVDYLDPAGRGGGVSLYQRNLLAALAEHAPQVQPVFLSCGMAHDLRPGRSARAPRWRRLRTPRDAIPRHEIVNSGLLSPAHADFASPAQLDHAPTEAAILDFIDATGPYDVIHLNGLEGIPANVLARIRARWPDTRLVLSLHNYYPLCPQVNLWREERVHCDDFAGGRHCLTCLPLRANPRVVRSAYGVETALARLGAGPGTAAFDRALLPLMKLGWHSLRRLAQARQRLRAPQPDAEPDAAPAPDAAGQAAAMAERRRRMVGLINDQCDLVLCVSDRVRAIAARHGIAPGILRTSYIGTAQAGSWARTAPRDSFLADDGTLRLAYLGYMRADKGFFFLLDALDALPDAMAARLHLTVAAAARPGEAMDRLQALAPRLAGLRHLNGYSHAGLDALLAGVDLGVVPVLWEDNLPQVAIEMHARHIPLLCADRGGARELGRCDALVFRAGDSADFARALGRVLDSQVTPADYFARAMAPVDMVTHLDALMALYADVSPGTGANRAPPGPGAGRAPPGPPRPSATPGAKAVSPRDGIV